MSKNAIENVKLTKIIATLGPVSGRPDMIENLVRAGVNIFRLNLSHGKHDVCRQWIRWIRATEKKLAAPIGILLDLQGPKIRVGKFENGAIHLRHGERLVFTTRGVTGSARLVPVQYRQFHRAVHPGDLVYLDDGNLSVEVIKITGQDVEVEVRTGGNLSNFKGLNLPDAHIETAALTAKDKRDLSFGLQEGVDFVALSFAGSARDIRQLRALIKKAGADADIVAKIERKSAVQNLKEIVEATDAVMVARGDLGVEISLPEVPVVQQLILRECAQQCKPVIVATQMLESMIENRRPTRAEISDISNAVKDSADAIMLSAETATGKHPVAAVEVMAETARRMEAHQRIYQRILPWSWFFKEAPPINLGITYSANRLVELLGAKAMIIFTLSGGTAKKVAAPRPVVPLLAFTSKAEMARKLTLLRGAIPFLSPVAGNMPGLGDMKEVFQILKKKGLARKGDRFVITAGIPIGIPQWTNIIRVEIAP